MLIEIMQSQEQRETRMKKNQQNFSKMQDNSKCINIRVMGVPEIDTEGKEAEKMSKEIMAENVKHFLKNSLHIHETQ